MDKQKLLNLTTAIVTSHASATGLTQKELLSEIEAVYSKMAALSGNEGEECVAVGSDECEEEAPVAPVVPMAAAFGAEKIFCMICGKGFTTLKKHLTASHELTAKEYRKRFGIPAGTVLAAKNYSEKRRQMAKDLNLADGLEKARKKRGRGK